MEQQPKDSETDLDPMSPQATQGQHELVAPLDDGEHGQKKKAGFSALKPFVIISSAYLLFTVTDGAVRMIVLLHAYNKGFSAMQVAVMFSLYELAGVVTNLLAGLLGAKWGIRWTLLAGLTLQMVGFGALYGWQDDWDKTTAIIYVTLAQMLCGVAKDLTKLGGKTVTKLVTPDEKQSQLFKLVSLITGWKNSLKGVGYFAGAACLDVDNEWGYEIALGMCVVLILAAYPWTLLSLDSRLGTAKSKNVTLKAILFNNNYNVNMLSLARLFLFGSRDLWFEVPLPFFLRAATDTGGIGLSRPVVGTFLGLYIIVYGQIQSYTPQLVSGPLGQDPPNKYAGALWAFLLAPITVAMACFLEFSPIFEKNGHDSQVAVLVVGVAAFAVVFAINSSVHSYLVVRYAEGDKVSQSVGFYYMSNAMGRLIGTMVSGALYSYAADTKAARMAACFWTSTVFCILSGGIALFIRDDEDGLVCGPLTLITAKAAASGALASEDMELEVSAASAIESGAGNAS